MNQIYRVIFNHATGVYQCVSEFAKAKGKTKSIKIAAMATALISGVAGATDYTSDDSVMSIMNESHTVSNGATLTILRRIAYVENNSTVSLSENATLTACCDFQMDKNATINLDNAHLNVNTKGEGDSAQIAIDGTAQITATNQSTIKTTGAYLATNANSKATVTLDNSTFDSKQTSAGYQGMTVGLNGTGELTLRNNAKIISSTLAINGDNSFVNADNSSIDVSGNMRIGGNGQGSLTSKNSTITANSDSSIQNQYKYIAIAVNNNSKGMLTTENTTLSNGNGSLTVAGRGNGTATLTNKSDFKDISHVHIADQAGSQGVLNLDDSSLTTNSYIAVGVSGKGELNANKSTIKTDSTIRIAYADSADGSQVTATDAILQVGRNLLVGEGGDGTLTAKNSQLIGAGSSSLKVGDAGTANGTLIADNTSTTGFNEFVIGVNGKGSATLSNNSSFDGIANVFVGSKATGIGELTVKDGSKINTEQVVIGGEGKGIVTVDNATLTTKSVVLGEKDTGTGTLTLQNNAVLSTERIVMADNARFVDNGANTITSGTGNFIKDGTGTLSMNVASKAWTGETHIDKGVLELNGDYTMRDNEVLAVAVNDGANDYGKLIVKGNADIDKGTLKVKASDIVKSLTTGTTPTGEWKDVVTATSLTGTNNKFATFTVVDKDGNAITNNANIIADYSETGAGKVHLKVEVPVTPPPPTPTPATGDFVTATINQGNIVSTPIAQVLDNVVANPTPDNANLVTALTAGSSGLSEQQLSQGVGELQPLFMGAVNRILHDNHRTFDGIVSTHKIDRQSNLWATGFGSRSSHNHKDSVVGYETDEKGIIIGADKVFDKTRLGVAVGVTDIDGKTTDTVRHDLDVRTVSGLLYGDYAVNDKTTLTAQVNAGKATIDGVRHISTLADTRANADYKADILGASIGASHQIGDDSRHIAPFVKLDYQTVKSEVYRETGAGVYNLAVAKNSQELITGTVGVNAKAHLSQNLALTGQMAVGLQQGDRQNHIHASFASTPDTDFATTGHKATVAVGTAGVGLTYTPTPLTKVGLQYQGEWRGNFDNQGVVLGVARKF